jgi:MFS family permease
MSAVRSTSLWALVGAEMVSILGTRMTYLALPWFVLVTTGSPGKMTLVLAVEMIPMALFGVPSGTLVQRYGARTVMLVSDFVRVPLMVSIPLLHAADALSFGTLLVLVFLLGCFMAPYFASQRVILPELVGEDVRAMSQANSLIEGGTAFAALAGPALAGVLIPWLDAPTVLYVDAATYAVAFLLVLLFVPRREPLPAAAETDGVLAGLRFVLTDKLLAPLTGTVVVFGFFSAGISAALPFYAFDKFDGSARIAGFFYTALGAGALVGTVLAIMLVQRVKPLRLAGLGILAFALPLWVLPFQPPLYVIFPALFLATLFTPLVNGPVIGVLTNRTPEGLRAKVMTAVITLSTLAAPGGFVAAGQVIERWGVVPVFAIVASGVTVTALLFSFIVLTHRDEEAVETKLVAGVEPEPSAAREAASVVDA